MYIIHKDRLDFTIIFDMVTYTSIIKAVLKMVTMKN